MRNVAIILAGGAGRRFGGSVPKQFMPLDGRTVVEHSIDVFDVHPAITEVLIVVHPEWRSHMKAIVQRNQWKKVSRVVDGGAERYESSHNAVAACNGYPDATNLLFHDAARPWVDAAIVDRVLAALGTYEAVGVAVRCTDTIWDVCEEERCVATIPNRSRMWRAQTPQAFRLPVIRKAYQQASHDSSFLATDDCGVVRRYMPSVKVAVVEGGEYNRKITFINDLMQ